jgi:phage terminase small subunit
MNTQYIQKLTPKQAAFCREYLVDLNATQAAIRAGYSRRTANEQGAQNLAKLSIQAEVRRLLEERIQRVEVDADYVVRTLVENVQRSMQAIAARDSEGNPIGEYRYDGAVANKALELLGRHLGMFTDRQEIAIRPTDNLLADLLARVEQSNNVIDQDYIEHGTVGRLSESRPAH